MKTNQVCKKIKFMSRKSIVKEQGGRFRKKNYSVDNILCLGI